MEDGEMDATFQLKEIFKDSLPDDSQYLDKNGLVQIANYLQLDQNDKKLLLSYMSEGDDDHNIQVDFEEFQKGFIAFLQDNRGSVTSTPIEDSQEVSPKFVRGRKRYGRRSKPENAALEQNGKTKAVKKGSPNQNLLNRGSNNNCNTPQQRLSYKFVEEMDKSPPSSKNDPVTPEENFSPQPLGDREIEEFISDNTDSKDTDIDSSFEDDSEKTTSLDVEQLQEILAKAGVGPQEYLNEEELARVVKHVGIKEITQEDYHQLFKKLDKDQDHQVSLEDLLQEFTHLNHNNQINANQTPNPGGGGTPAAKLFKRQSTLNLEERILTDKTSDGFQFLSAFDPEHTGFASPSLITELWESAGVHNGLTILEGMGFNISDKVSLVDLWMILETELKKANEGPVYRVAVFTYQMELTYLKQILDQVTSERDKLRSDLHVANERNTRLLEEVDEMNVSLEKTSKQQLQLAEKKYQDQLREMQTSLEQDRESLNSLVTKYKHQLDAAVEKLKEEENHASQLHQDNIHLKQEVCEVSNELTELHKITRRHKIDLEILTRENEQLADLVSKQKIIEEQQEQFSLSTVHKFKEETKALQDRVDELLIENESQKHQLEACQKGSESNSKKAKRNGSVLSDYVTKKRIGCKDSTDDSDEETEMNITEKLKKAHEKELEEIKTHFDQERKNLEQNYKLEITEVEDVFNHEKGELLECFIKEKETMQEELEKQKLRYFQECEIEQERLLEEQKKCLMEEFCQEKAVLHQKYEEERKKIEQDLLQERHNFIAQLKNDKIIPFSSDDLTRQKAELELKLKLVQEELEMKLQKERAELMEKFEEERINIEEKYRMQLFDYEHTLSQGLAGLKGKLKDDFFTLLEGLQEERWSEMMQEGHEALKGKLRDDFDILVKSQKEEMFKEMQQEQETFEKALKEEYTKLLEEMETDRLKLLQLQDEKMAALVEAERELYLFKTQCEQIKSRNEILEKALQDLQNSNRIPDGEKVDNFKEVMTDIFSRKSQDSELLLEEILHKQKRRQKKIPKVLDESPLSDDVKGHGPKIVEYQNRIKELQDFLLVQSQENREMIMAMETMHDSEIQRLQEENADMEFTVSQMSERLNKQERKFKKELREWTKCTNLTKDLYVENSEMMNALKISEERQIQLERINYKLDKKCKALQSLLMRVCPAAMK